ncbi:MAG: hypothetical protein Q9167_004631 [Letrouitia subvulpina]
MVLQRPILLQEAGYWWHPRELHGPLQTAEQRSDAFAILLAAHHPSLELLGISTVHGNASLAQTTANVGSILTAIGKGDVPYYSGIAKPFCRNAVHAPDIHGETGIDGTDLLPEAVVPPRKNTSAILAMRDAILAQPAGRTWLVATGTLTNVALLFSAFPEVVCHIKGLSIMGGAIGGRFTQATLGRVKGEGERLERFGNCTPWAEFNIYCDPEAAQSIFSNKELAGKTTLIPLDLTHQVLATKDVQQLVLYGSSASSGVGSSKIRHMYHDLLLFFAHTYAEVFGITAGPPLHDPLAVAVILSDEMLLFDDRGGERWHVDVVIQGVHSDVDEERGQLGRTKISKVEQGGVRIPRGLDIPVFWNVVDKCLKIAEQDSNSMK